MKVLEINGFMTWASSYEGNHEIVRWIPRQKFGVREAYERTWWSDFRQGFNLLLDAPNADYDLLVCGSFGRAYGGGIVRRVAKGLGERILSYFIILLKMRASCPMAVIDVSDDATINPVNRKLLSSTDTYFRRELPVDPFHCFDALRGVWSRLSIKRSRNAFEKSGWIQKLKPISLGCRELEPSKERRSVKEKEWDIFYVGNSDGKPCREGIGEALKGLASKGVRVFHPPEALEINDYMEAMWNSKLALSPPGYGWDCHRHYEAAMLGTVPVTPFPTIRRHHPLLAEKHCFFYDPEKGLQEQLGAMLDDGDRLEEIGREARKHAQRWHTHEAIFSYVLETTMNEVSEIKRKRS